MATVNCKGCGAELQDDRKLCPHCQTPVVRAADAALVQAADDKEKQYIRQIVRLDQQITLLEDDNDRLVAENNQLRAANAELLKQVAPQASTPVVEKSGPGVVADVTATANTKAEVETETETVATATKDMKTL